jgi:hypothetical protein
MKRSERFPGRYVKAADLKPEGAVVTMDRVEMEDVGQGNDKKTKPVLYFKNASKALVLNSTNDEAIGKLFGDDDRDWRGQRIVLYPTTTSFGGKLVECVRVRALDDEVVEEDENPAPKKKSKALRPKDDSDLDVDLDDQIPF